MSPLPEIVCLDCGQHSSYQPGSTQCEACGSQWRQAQYDYPNLGRTLPSLVKGRPSHLWRYLELLPIQEFNPSLSMGEGFTPLIHAANLGIMLGCPNIFIKDERQGPTSSFKDRQAAVSIAALKEAGINEVVLASTGNVAISFSAYAVRAGIKLWAFLTSLVPAEKMREVAIYGTQVVKVTGSYDQAKQVAAEFARQRNLHLESGSRSIPAVEAMKTIAFEIAEQLTEQLGHPPGSSAPTSPGNGSPSAGAATAWRVPDWYFQSVSGGLGPLGVQKGFYELQQMGLTKRLPALACIQTEGCAPMAHAWRQNLEVAEPIHSPRTHIATLSTGDPGRTYTLLRNGMLTASQRFPMPAGAIGTGGIIDSVSDEETFRTIHILAKMEGISVEPASAVAFAGLIRLVRAGVIQASDTVVVNCTGHTIAVEQTVLGQGWARNVILPSQGRMDTPQEGLLAALSRVTEDRFPRVAIVDDTEPSRRLIRRILQSQGNYTLFEASNGLEAIELARRELPDLIILDLMMPELDGFAVLDELKADPETAPIPVIVVTAKELTTDEKKRLEGQIHSLMQKGEFMNDDLLDEVRSLVN